MAKNNQYVNPWTREEIEFLRENYKKIPTKNIAKRLGRTYRSISKKAFKLNLCYSSKKWTKEEVEFLKKNYKIISSKEIAEKFGRTNSGLLHKAMKLGLTLPHRPWTKGEIEFLKNNYKIISYRDIAKKLDRTYYGVQSRAFNLKLDCGRQSFKKGNKSWNEGLTKENDERLRTGGEKSSKTKTRLYAEGKIKLSGWALMRNEDPTYQNGENHPLWKGGKSFEPYGIEFNNKLREQIRKRDNYRCQQCFRHQDELFTKSRKRRKLSIHHVDFDKKNNNPENLISLCQNCHMQTNFDRKNWVTYFQNKINGGNK